MASVHEFVDFPAAVAERGKVDPESLRDRQEQIIHRTLLAILYVLSMLKTQAGATR